MHFETKKMQRQDGNILQGIDALVSKDVLGQLVLIYVSRLDALGVIDSTATLLCKVVGKEGTELAIDVTGLDSDECGLILEKLEQLCSQFQRIIKEANS